MTFTREQIDIIFDALEIAMENTGDNEEYRQYSEIYNAILDEMDKINV